MTLVPPKEVNTVDWNQLLLSYGIPSALIALEVLEEDGFYEVCRDILDAINDTSASTLLSFRAYPSLPRTLLNCVLVR